MIYVSFLIEKFIIRYHMKYAFGILGAFIVTPVAGFIKAFYDIFDTGHKDISHHEVEVCCIKKNNKHYFFIITSIFYSTYRKYIAYMQRR